MAIGLSRISTRGGFGRGGFTWRSSGWGGEGGGYSGRGTYNNGSNPVEVGYNSNEGYVIIKKL